MPHMKNSLAIHPSTPHIKNCNDHVNGMIIIKQHRKTSKRLPPRIRKSCKVNNPMPPQCHNCKIIVFASGHQEEISAGGNQNCRLYMTYCASCVIGGHSAVISSPYIAFRTIKSSNCLSRPSKPTIKVIQAATNKQKPKEKKPPYSFSQMSSPNLDCKPICLRTTNNIPNITGTATGQTSQLATHKNTGNTRYNSVHISSFLCIKLFTTLFIK